MTTFFVEILSQKHAVYILKDAVVLSRHVEGRGVGGESTGT